MRIVRYVDPDIPLDFADRIGTDFDAFNIHVLVGHKRGDFRATTVGSEFPAVIRAFNSTGAASTCLR